MLFWLAWLQASVMTPAGEAGTNEEILFQAAGRSFNNGFYDRADREFSEFISQFPNSKRALEVVLLRAQAKYALSQYDAVITLLNNHLAGAGKEADKFQYWMAEAYYHSGRYASAAGMYQQLITQYPESFFLSNAIYGEAMAWFKLGDTTHTLAILASPGGPFQKVAEKQPNDPYVLRGKLLLSEVWLSQKKYPQTEAILAELANRTLPPQLDWQRQYLLVREELEHRHLAEALKNMPSLLLAATNTGSTLNLAETVLLHGQVLELAHQPEKASQVYTQSLVMLPEPMKRQTLLKLVDLNLGGTNRTIPLQYLAALANQYPNAPDADQVRLTLGELLLKEYHFKKSAGSLAPSPPAAAPGPDLLQQALTNFEFLAVTYTNSPLVAPARLNQGWCYWEADKIEASMQAFKQATALYPPGTNQALARLKWADTQLKLKNFAGARQNYGLIIAQAAGQAEFPKPLLELALYEMIQTCASMKPPDLAGATNTLEKLIAQFPQSEYGDRCHLLVGQLMSHAGKTQPARSLFAAARQRFPNSLLKPELELAIARAYAQETNWLDAASQYEQWLARHTNHTERAKVEFDLAWAYDQAGRETNALSLFSNYATKYPASPLAPAAQYWVGNHYFNLGRNNPTNYVAAEEYYQGVYLNTNFPLTELSYQAQLSAGRAAVAGQRYLPNAAKHFSQLINLLEKDTNAPPSLLAETYIALGDTYTASDVTNKFASAINVFSRVPDTNRLAPRAWAKIAECHYHLAALDFTRYAKATNFYLMVITNQTASADIEVRTEAEVGLGALYKSQAGLTNKTAAERSALYGAALEHFLNVAHEQNLRGKEKPVAFWLAKAGQEAADILEYREQWPAVIKLCEDLLPKLPPNYSSALEKKLERAKKHP